MQVYDNIACESAPVADSHLANKAYVDAAVANGAGTASVSGDSVVSIPAHSLISCDIEPTEDSHLVNKAYVDAAVAAAGTAAPIEEPAALGRVVIVDTLSDAATHTGTSLRDAIAAVSSNENVLIKFSVSGTITLEQGEITTTGNIAIDGENKITISGGGVSRLFYVAASTTLKLYRLTLTGGNGIGQGSSDSGTIYGGAVYIYGSSTSNGGELFAQSVTFSGNAISSSNATAAQSGVVQIGNYAAGLFIGCTFSGNSLAVTKASSTAYGGCIGLGRTGYARCEGCTFSGNSVSAVTTAQGGAVYGGTVTLEDCTFTNNQLTGGSTRKGGAVFTGTGTIDILGCEFSGNSVSTASSNCQGGAVFTNSTQSVNIIDCDISENTAYYGGGAYVTGGRICRILRSVFDNNSVHASGRGAAIYVTAVSVSIESCEFKNHSVGAASGVIYVYGSTGSPTITINRCKITGNSSSATTTGLVYIANAGQVYLYNTVFTANSFTATSGNHKCVYTTGSSWAYIYNCTFTANTNKGGAFYAAAGGVNIYNSVEYGNGSASGKGTNATVNAAKFLSDQSASVGRDIAYDSTKPLFAADGFTPVANSQVIDKGNDTYAVTEYDLNGKARVSGTKVDLGAVEYLGA